MKTPDGFPIFLPHTGLNGWGDYLGQLHDFDMKKLAALQSHKAKPSLPEISDDQESVTPVA